MPDFHELARKQLADYDAHDPGRMFEGSSPIGSQADAYRLQMEVGKLRIARGERLAGYKIGCVSEVIRKQLHMDRTLFGHVWGSELHRSGTGLNFTAFANLAIEGEFAVRLASDIPGSEWLENHKDQSIAAMFPVIELHNHILRGPHRAVELIANNGIHAGVVLPEEEQASTNPDSFLSETLTIYKNGLIVGEACGDLLRGVPFANLCQLVEHLAVYGIHLTTGQLVLTGAPLPLYPVVPGDRIDVRTQLLGGVSAHIL